MIAGNPYGTGYTGTYPMFTEPFPHYPPVYTPGYQRCMDQIRKDFWNWINNFADRGRQKTKMNMVINHETRRHDKEREYG